MITESKRGRPYATTRRDFLTIAGAAALGDARAALEAITKKYLNVSLPLKRPTYGYRDAGEGVPEELKALGYL
jgi:hypothetical protein